MCHMLTVYVCWICIVQNEDVCDKHAFTCLHAGVQHWFTRPLHWLTHQYHTIPSDWARFKKSTVCDMFVQSGVYWAMNVCDPIDISWLGRTVRKFTCWVVSPWWDRTSPWKWTFYTAQLQHPNLPVTGSISLNQSFDCRVRPNHDINRSIQFIRLRHMVIRQVSLIK